MPPDQTAAPAGQLAYPQTFRFTGGRLEPAPDADATIEAAIVAVKAAGGGMDRALDAIGYHCESTYAADDLAVYRYGADAPDGRDPNRWIFLPGDCSSYATVLVAGWADYFDAVRYFQPFVALRMMADE